MAEVTISNIKNRIYNFDKWVVLLLITMPLILIAFDDWNVRTSISNYVYMKHNQVYYFLLIIGSTMFAYNGALWRKNYQILLGATLLGVALTPHKEYVILHSISAGLFFLGSIFVMIYYSSKKQRIYKIYVGLFITVVMLLHFILKAYSLFYAEWLGILPIAIHYLGESKGIVD